MAYMIKRYANRKLYDVQESRYVTLEELEQLIRGGNEISVIDATTGENLTSVILAQILLEKEGQGRQPLPAALLHHLIQYVDARIDAVRDGVIEHFLRFAHTANLRAVNPTTGCKYQGG